MITGLFVKNFKIYKRQKFIPISTHHRWTAFVGPNGAGKSSILEALNTYFNDAAWNVNKTARKKGETSNFINLPFVCPVFLVKKSLVAPILSKSGVSEDTIDRMSAYLWNIGQHHQPSVTALSELASHIRLLETVYKRDDYHIIISGVRFSMDRHRPYFGPLHQHADFIRALGLEPVEKATSQLEQAKRNDEIIATSIGDINSLISEIYDYIYIPADTSVADYTKLETSSMQILMGRDINKEIADAISAPILAKINASLDKTVEDATSGLDQYRYEKPIGGKKNITIGTLSGLITREYFSIRELSKANRDGTSIPVSSLSSGEQRRTLIDVTSNYLLKNAPLHENTIVAIDEPEASLHTSLCYDQFEALFDVARRGTQCIVTTHWYGFLPIAQDGSTHFVERADDDSARIDSYDLKNFRENVPHRQSSSKGELPFDVSLKSANDLVQSIAASLRLDSPYNWILCEGASEQIYFSHFFSAEIENRRLRLLPLGGAPEVLSIYRYLEAALADKTFARGGKVLALVDTDEQLLRHQPSSSTRNLDFRRLLLSEDDVLSLVPLTSNSVSPPTEIEDCLEASIFVKTLEQYNRAELDLDIKSIRRPKSKHAGRALDMRDTERRKLKAFFEVPDRKYEFAKRYVETAKSSGKVREEPLVPIMRKLLDIEQ